MACHCSLDILESSASLQNVPQFFFFFILCGHADLKSNMMRNLSLLQDFLTNYFSYLSNICTRFPPLYFSGPGNGDVLSSMNLAGKVS